MSIGFGVIGLGNRGYKYALRTIAEQTDCHIVIVCDVDERNFDKFQSAEKTRDFHEVIEHPEVDAVFIATPDDTHAEIIKAAAAKKKHILCEKPLDVSEEKIREIYELMKDYDHVIEIGYVLRYARLFKKVKDLVSSGVIGELVMMNATDHIHYGGYAFFHDWHRTRAKSTSLLLQKATHTLDILNWVANDLPQQVVAFGGLSVMGEPGALKKFGHPVANELTCRVCPVNDTCEESIHNLAKEKKISWDDHWPDQCVFNSEVDVDDHQSVMICYQKGVKATYQLCQFSPFYKREFQLFGSKGELHFDDVSNEIKIYDRLKPEVMTIQNNFVETNMEPGDEEQIRDFIHSIQTKNEPVSNLTSGTLAALTALAAQESIDKNTIEKIEL